MSKHGYSIVIASAFLALPGCGSIHRDGQGLGPDEASPRGDHADSADLDPAPSGWRGRGPRLPEGCAATIPSLVLSTPEGEQPGELGSYCLFSGSAGCGICADTSGGMPPKQFTIVHSGDRVALRVLDGTLVTPVEGSCVPECPPELRIVSLGCEAEANETRVLADGDVWQIDLPPGTYQIEVDAHFASDDGSYGQTHVMFGLIVDDAREPAIVDGRGEAAVDCGDGGTSEPYWAS